MKKIFLAVLFCLLFANGYSQDIEYISSNVGVVSCINYCTTDKSVSSDNSASVMIYAYLCKDLNLRLSGNFVFFNIPDWCPRITFGMGLEYSIIGDFYCFAETYPALEVKGVGSQVEGDYTAFHLPLDLGLGYYFSVGKDRGIYTELYFEKEFTLHADIPEMKRNSINLGFCVGYSYKFFKDIR